MKAKLKGLSGPAIKGWFFTHGEKLAFGAAGLIFVMLIYKAVGRETLPADKEPPRLAERASQATSHVADSKWDSNSLQPPIYVERAKREDVVAVNYRLRSFDRPLYEIKGKRGEPTILAAEGMRATAGHGILALFTAVDPNNPPPAANPVGDVDMAPGQKALPGVRAPAGSTPEGKYWAVVTGLIPIKKQLGEYQKEFERAKAEDRTADVPNYLGFTIERATIDPTSPETLNWQPVDKAAAKAFNARWATNAREVVHAKFIDPNFTMQLPPLLGEDWGANVAHADEITLLNAAPAPPTPEAAPAPDPAAPAQPPNEFDGIARDVPKPRPDQEAAAAAARDLATKPAEYKLFRFFDFTVEPGKQYRYRILLGLKNPNFGVPVKYLKKPESNQQQVVRAPMSEPTPIVFIPKAEQILAGPRPDGRPTIPGEPEANVMLTKFDMEKGTFAAKEIKVMRGNPTFYEGSVTVRDPIKNSLKDENIRFNHNALVLDIRGGQELSGKAKTATPMEVLMLDSEGNIVTSGNELLARTELSDAEAYKQQQIATAPTAVKQGPGDGGGGPTPPVNPGGGILEPVPAKRVRTK